MNLVSDGDSATYKAITDLNEGAGPYGKEHQVKKEECVNHVAKRLGTGLRTLKERTVVQGEGKKRRKQILGGRSKLTEPVITRMSYYFGVSVRRCANTTPEQMNNDIMSSLYHCTSTDEEPRHHLCPASEDSWYFFERAKAKGQTPPSHSTMKIRFTLEPHEFELVKGVYDRVTTNEMMMRCLRGKTQNANESLQRIWAFCRKNKRDPASHQRTF